MRVQGARGAERDDRPSPVAMNQPGLCVPIVSRHWLARQEKHAFFVTRADRIRRYTYFDATEFLVRIF